MKNYFNLIIVVVSILLMTSCDPKTEIPAIEDISSEKFETVISTDDRNLIIDDTAYKIKKNDIVYLTIELHRNFFKQDTSYDNHTGLHDISMPYVGYWAKGYYAVVKIKEQWVEMENIDLRQLDIILRFGNNKSISLVDMLTLSGNEPVYEGNKIHCKFRIPRRYGKSGEMRINYFNPIMGIETYEVGNIGIINPDNNMLSPDFFVVIYKVNSSRFPLSTIKEDHIKNETSEFLTKIAYQKDHPVRNVEKYIILVPNIKVDIKRPK